LHGIRDLLNDKILAREQTSFIKYRKTSKGTATSERLLRLINKNNHLHAPILPREITVTNVTNTL